MDFRLRSCWLCGRWLHQSAFCKTCTRDLERFPVLYRRSHGLDVFSLLHLNSDVSRFIYRAKDKRDHKLLDVLAHLFGHKLMHRIYVPIVGVIPAPPRVQGDNDHADVIAQGIADVFHVPVARTLLTRLSSDTDQKEKPLWGRFQKRIVATGQAQLKDFSTYDDGYWLLVDDVVTTGFTLFQCHRELGSPRAFAVTLASRPRLTDLIANKNPNGSISRPKRHAAGIARLKF